MNRVAPIGQSEETSVQTLHPKRIKQINNSSLQGFPRTCKICLQEQPASSCILSVLSEQEYNEEELIIPCECKGSVAYVHQKCIKLWIQKQAASNKTKRAFCQLCKSQIFFKRVKVKQCQCTLSNLWQTSPLAELVIICVLTLVQNNLARLVNFQILRNALLAILALVSLISLITIFLIIRQTFLKTYTQIHRIYSLQQSQRLGFIEPKLKDKQLSLSLVAKGKKRKLTRDKRESRRASNSPFGSISPEVMLAWPIPQ